MPLLRGVRGQQGATLREDDLKYFSEFLREFQAETDRGAALVGAALIDDRLVRLLKAHFLECKESEDLLKGGSAPLGAFSARIKMAYCLGLITDLEYKECDYIRSEEHTSELQSRGHLVCRLLLDKKNITNIPLTTQHQRNSKNKR